MQIPWKNWVPKPALRKEVLTLNAIRVTFQNFRILKFCLTLDVILGGRVTYK
jgi:hypothetical protein